MIGGNSFYFLIRRENDLNKWLKHVKRGTKSKWNGNKSTRNKWGPLRVHRMNWKVRFRELTGWRPKNDEERTKDGGKSSRNHPWKCFGCVTEVPRCGFSSQKQFFFTNFKWSSDTRRVECFSSSILPLFIGKWGRSLPPSSPRRARLLPSEGTSWKAQVGLVAICIPTIY